jgi:hypothetical protein
MKTATVTNDKGVQFEIRVIEPGDRYGLDNTLVYPDPESSYESKTAAHGDKLIEWWDVAHNQFVSRYYLSTLATRRHPGDLSLQGDEPRWTISAANVRTAINLALTGVADDWF